MSILNDLGSISTNLRDRAHATKIFVDGNYLRSPKYTFLYYVQIESTVSDSAKNIGVLVKSVDLPKFDIETRKLNDYNRKIYVQTSLKYEPVNIVFHDDNANSVRDFWREYLSYYYRNADNNEMVFDSVNNSRYQLDKQHNDWGYTPKVSGPNSPFLKKITIYSLHKKRFSSYSLMNPTVTRFQHGEHQSGQSETLQNSMTVEFETVLYSQGDVVEIPGFLDLYYDKHPSPLTPAGGGTASILGQGGLLETIGEIGSDLTQNRPWSAIFKGVQGIQNLGKMDLKNAAIGELFEVGKSILRGNNPTKNIFVPNLSSSIENKLGGLINSGSTISQGISNVSNWLSSASNIGSVAKSGLMRVNQEITDASAFLSKSIPTNFTNSLPKLGSLGSLLPFNATFDARSVLTNNSSDEFLNQITQEILLPLENINSGIPLNQYAQIKTPIQQGSMNSAQAKNQLQHNQIIASQTKTNLQIENHKFKEQQQLALDAIITLTSKLSTLIAENTNTLLIKQLELQILQQQETIDANEKKIIQNNQTIKKLDEMIQLITAKLSGLV